MAKKFFESKVRDEEYCGRVLVARAGYPAGKHVVEWAVSTPPRRQLALPSGVTVVPYRDGIRVDIANRKNYDLDPFEDLMRRTFGSRSTVDCVNSAAGTRAFDVRFGSISPQSEHEVRVRTDESRRISVVHERVPVQDLAVAALRVTLAAQDCVLKYIAS